MIKRIFPAIHFYLFQKNIKKTIYCFTVNSLFISIFNLYHNEPLIIPVNSSLHIKSFSLFYHSIYYSAINLSNQVSMTIINWLAPFHSCSISSRVLYNFKLFEEYGVVLLVCIYDYWFTYISTENPVFMRMNQL